jgi:hypothetical protein
MDRPESEIGILTSSQFQASEDGDVFALVDQWIRQFEMETDVHLDAPLTKPSAASDPPQPESDARPSATREDIKAEWNRLKEGRRRGIALPDADTETPLVKQDALPLKSTGLLITFTDAAGGTISLSQSEGRLQHRGSVAVRGRGDTIEAACRDIGLPDHVARALEFVAAWFGHPFDAVNLRSADSQILTWGFWGLGNDELARCLAEWKRQSPESFDRDMTAFGVDVSRPDRGGAESGPDARRPALRVQSGRRVAHGREAEWMVASEPHLLAVLARAGRDAAAQKAQIDTVIATWITPVMFHAWDSSDREDLLTVDVLKSPRAVAALLYLVRRHGPRTATRLLQVVNERSRPQEDEDAWLAGLVRSLRHLNRDSEASEVLRISSSPELTIPRSEH